MRIDRRSAALAAGLLLAAGLTSCSVFGGDDDTGAGTTGDQSVKLADDGTVQGALVSLTRPWRGYDVTVDVLRLKRYDTVMRLEFAVTPRSRGGSDPLSSYVFSAGQTSHDTGGVYLLDTQDLKRYPVLMSSDDDCVCSSDLRDLPLDQPTVLFADYPAAPDGVKSLNVVLPQLGVLPAVGIS